MLTVKCVIEMSEQWSFVYLKPWRGTPDRLGNRRQTHAVHVTSNGGQVRLSTSTSSEASLIALDGLCLKFTRRHCGNPHTCLSFALYFIKTSHIAIMSDFEDEMDVDGPAAVAAKDEITFSSNNTNSKGKRSAANLPVEAEDSLPW